MDLRQLNALIAVADHASFSAAARALHTVQSNVSTHVARLERELGATLIDRSTGQLTDEGVTVVQRGRRVLGEIENIASDVAAMRDDVRGVVRTGIIGTTGRWLAPPVLEAMEQRYPGVRTIIVDATTTSLLPLVISGELDHAVASTPADDPETHIEPLFDEDCIIIAPNGHPLAELTEVSVAELADHALLLTPTGTTFRTALDSEAAAVGVELKVRAELDGMRLLASMAYQGFGPALLPASASPTWDSGDWQRVRVTGLTPRRVDLVRRRRTTPSAATRAVREVIRDVIRAEGAKLPGIHLRLAD